MTVWTTEYEVMRKLDGYVKEASGWELESISRKNGEVAAKTYRAPKGCLCLKGSRGGRKKRAAGGWQAQAERSVEEGFQPELDLAHGTFGHGR